MGVRTASRVFGPVPSRRLGRSLGINSIHAKQCSYSCIYCQAGRTTCLRDSRRDFAAPEDLRDDVEAALDAARAKGSAARIGVNTTSRRMPLAGRGLERSGPTRGPLFQTAA